MSTSSRAAAISARREFAAARTRLLAQVSAELLTQAQAVKKIQQLHERMLDRLVDKAGERAGVGASS